MLVLTRRLHGRAGFPHCFKYSMSVTRQQQKLEPTMDVVHQFEHDGSRILRIVRKRLDERVTLLAQVGLAVCSMYRFMALLAFGRDDCPGRCIAC
jgi:hypothetical protein